MDKVKVYSYAVKPVYKGHSGEPENVLFIYGDYLAGLYRL
jgi:hypothetical protein